jgi:N-acetyl sugar amidotransferase
MQNKPSVSYQICTHCVLDTSVPNIRFDDKGVCNFCHQFFERRNTVILSDSQKMERLKATTGLIRKDGEGKPYDCIIGLSGGVDSSYVAWLVKKQGLRPLAVHFDNGWNSEIAVSNIEHICKKLDIELYTYVVDWNEFRDLQLSFLKAGVANAEFPTDHGIFATLYKLAGQFGVKYIVDGVNHATEFVRTDFTAAGWAYSDLRHLKAIHKQFGTIPLKTFPTMSFYKKAWLQKVKGIQQVSLLNYVNYIKSDAVLVLQEELGWRSYGGKHHESTFTKWHQVVYLPTRFGFDKRRVHLSDLVLFGQISRQKALEEINTPPISPTEKQQLELYVQKKLGLSPEAYATILNTPSRPHSDYPTDAFIMKLYAQFKQRASPVT